MRLFIVAIVMGFGTMGSFLRHLCLYGHGIRKDRAYDLFEGGAVGLDLLTLFSCTRGVGWARGGREAPVGPSWTVNPGLPLMIAVMVSLIISPFLATYWPEGEVDGLPSEGSRSWAVDAPVDLVLLHSLVVHPGCLKVLNLWCLHYHNIFPNTREPVSDYEKDQV